MAEILVIEDNSNLRQEIRRHFEALGHEVTCASDGTEGMETLLRVAFDVVVLDIRLPGLQGTDVLKRLNDTLPCRPPIIVVTGHGDKQNAIAAVHFGAFDFLEKPFSPADLEKSIDRALTIGKSSAQSYRAYLEANEHEELTEREREVAFLATEGLSNEEIATRLTLGLETVKSHLKKVFRKLAVTNRTSLASKLRK